MSIIRKFLNPSTRTCFSRPLHIRLQEPFFFRGYYLTTSQHDDDDRQYGKLVAILESETYYKTKNFFTNLAAFPSILNSRLRTLVNITRDSAFPKRAR